MRASKIDILDHAARGLIVVISPRAAAPTATSVQGYAEDVAAREAHQAQQKERASQRELFGERVPAKVTLPTPAPKGTRLKV